MRAVPLSHRWCWLLLIGVVAAVGCTSHETARVQRPVGYAEARTVVNRRCIECHSEQPINHAFPIAPKGVMLDTALQMQQYARRIEASVAVERTMPLANMSGMPDEERWILARWVEMGARIPSGNGALAQLVKRRPAVYNNNFVCPCDSSPSATDAVAHVKGSGVSITLCQ